MKIEVEIPDWAAEARITILAGIECVAVKDSFNDFWLVKDARCNRCGECCLDNPNTPFGVDDEGKCVKLYKDEDRGEYWCMAKSQRPYNCCLDPTEQEMKNLDCCITYKRVKA